jgi:hypothetical protein
VCVTSFRPVGREEPITKSIVVQHLGINELTGIGGSVVVLENGMSRVGRDKRSPPCEFYRRDPLLFKRERHR